MGGALVLKGDSYLLPWGEPQGGDGLSSPSRADKMYAFSASGGAHTFDLTAQFARTGRFTLYKLTDQGRVKAADITPHDGQVTLTTDKNQPYVLVPRGGRAPHTNVDYGQGTGLSDPGFNAGNLTAWHPRGGAGVARTDNGDNVARLGTKAASGISQQVKGLTAGRSYTLSADVEIAAGQRRATTVSVIRRRTSGGQHLRHHTRAQRGGGRRQGGHLRPARGGHLHRARERQSHGGDRRGRGIGGRHP